MSDNITLHIRVKVNISRCVNILLPKLSQSFISNLNVICILMRVNLRVEIAYNYNGHFKIIATTIFFFGYH